MGGGKGLIPYNGLEDLKQACIWQESTSEVRLCAADPLQLELQVLWVLCADRQEAARAQPAFRITVVSRLFCAQHHA